MSFRLAAKRIPLLILGLLLVPVAMAQSAAEDTDTHPRVVIRTTLGDMVVELNRERAPRTVDNFLAYADDNFYADTVFHRVIEGFMIQGGGFNLNFQRKTTRPPVSNEAYNGLRNERYTIAMARTTAPHSATSQFFINSEDNRNLDHTGTTQRGWGYTVFGRVVEGKEIVDTISRVRTGPGGPFSRDVPYETIAILSVDRLLASPDNEQLPAADTQQPGEPVEGAAAANPASTMIKDAQLTTQKTSGNLDMNNAREAVSSDIVQQN